jgi:hypothetical protein
MDRRKFMKTRKPIQVVIFAMLFSFLSAYQASAISEGGKCDIKKFGNSGVMSNGKIHGGQVGPNTSYAGPIYYCDGAVWVYWRTAQPKSKSKGNSSLVDVSPGQLCSSLGKKVSSKNYGKLKCMYVRTGRLQALMWMRA